MVLVQVLVQRGAVDTGTVDAFNTGKISPLLPLKEEKHQSIAHYLLQQRGSHQYTWGSSPYFSSRTNPLEKKFLQILAHEISPKTGRWD